MITLVILCAGQSRRMGEDKLLLPLGDRPLLRWTLEAGHGISPRLAVCHEAAVATIGRACGYEIIHNPEPARGISSSIRLAVEAADAGSALLFLPGDQPLIRPQTLVRMADAYARTGRPVVASLHGDWRSPCLFPPDFRSALLTLTGDAGGKRLLRGRDDVQTVEATPVEFLDADTPEAYRALLAQMER